MIHGFLAGFSFVARGLAVFAGAVAAVLAFLVLLALAGLIFGAVFHAGTSWLVRRWRSRGREPTGWFARILLRDSRRV